MWSKNLKSPKMAHSKKFAKLFLIALLVIICSSVNAYALGLPIVTTLTANNITSSSATLRGSVNPNDYSTDVSFISYITPSSPLLFPETFKTNIGDGASSVEVSYTQTDLKPGTPYTYAVKATNFRGVQVGLEVTFTTLIDPPSEPQLKATVSGSSIILDWVPSGDGGSAITRYNIYRDTASGAKTLLKTVSNTPTSYTDILVSNGQTYYYKVSAVNSIGEGAMSNEASATVPVQPTTIVPTTHAVPVTTLPLSRLTVMVSSEPESIGIGLKSTIKVTVMSGGNEISGADVMLTSTSGGKVTPGLGTTDLFGQFTSTFTGSAEGIVTVRALARKAGYEDSKGDVQININPIPTPTVTSDASSKPTSENKNANNGTNDAITMPTPTISEEPGFVVNISVILYIVVAACIIFLIYWKWNMKSKDEKAQKESVIKSRRCSNCGLEAPGKNNFCEKCGKPLK